MSRITVSDLENLVKRINVAKKYQPVRKIGRYKNGKFKSNAGYHLSGAYGGYKLVFSKKDESGVRNVTSGYVPKKELYNQMKGILYGVKG
jgi:hypothetical protein